MIFYKCIIVESRVKHRSFWHQHAQFNFKGNMWTLCHWGLWLLRRVGYPSFLSHSTRELCDKSWAIQLCNFHVSYWYFSTMYQVMLMTLKMQKCMQLSKSWLPWNLVSNGKKNKEISVCVLFPMEGKWNRYSHWFGNFH